MAEAALAIGAVAGGGLSIASAVQQNRAVRSAKAATGQANIVQRRQITDQNNLERLKILRRSAQLRGRLRVAAGEAGLGDFGSLALLDQQNTLDTALNLDVLRTNERSLLDRAASEYRADNARLTGQLRSSLLSGFEGALGGASSGLSIARSFPKGESAE
jgi:hypothetical protein